MKSGKCDSLKVLLMDDDEAVLDIGARLLEHLGHRVAAVEDGARAVEAFRRAHDSGERFDLAVLDLNVPGGMDGKQTLAELRKIDPSVPALASSGYSDSQSEKSYREMGFSGCISKPYTLDQLERKLSRVTGQG